MIPRMIVPVVLATLLGCSSRSPHPGGPAPKSFDPADHAAICEAVFRHLFEDNNSAAQKEAKAFFLTMEDKDPQDPFLARFASHPIPVRKGSEFEIGKGLRFTVERIDRIDDDTADVHCGYYEHQLSAAGYILRVERSGGGWTVTKLTMLWIS